MQFKKLFLIFSILALISSAGFADAPLKQSLGLSMEQARQVKQIQKTHRKQFASGRTKLHREQRKLRRAKKAYDSATVAKQEEITARLIEQLRQVRQSENAQIRRLLTPAQRQKFEAVLEQRRAMVGSSRDVKIFQ